jgi:hypothetical protein
MNPSSYLSVAVSIAAVVSSARAASVTVPNASFESPVTTNFTQLPEDSGATGEWERYGFGAVILSTGPNPYNYAPAGLHGLQYGNGSASQFTGIFQDIAAYDGSGSPDQYWQAGYVYTLSIGVFARQDSLPSATSSLNLNFYSRQFRAGAPTRLATAVVVPADLSSSEIRDFEVSYTVLPGDPAVGKPIGIWMETTAGTSGDWGYDNVRVTYVLIPEPSALLLASVGLLGLLRRRR